MKKIVLTTILLLGICVQTFGQRYMTRNGTIRFFSEAPLENIEAVNRQVSSALDVESGEFVFRVLIRAFRFEKALMQEHFNENFMESHIHPNASFQGVVKNHENIDFTQPGVHEVEVEGDLTIRGITHRITEKGTIEVKDGKLHCKSTFTVLVKDYDITIPRAVSDNIAREIEVTVDVVLE
jgi:hypothetical protein